MVGAGATRDERSALAWVLVRQPAVNAGHRDHPSSMAAPPKRPQRRDNAKTGRVSKRCRDGFEDDTKANAMRGCPGWSPPVGRTCPTNQRSPRGQGADGAHGLRRSTRAFPRRSLADGWSIRITRNAPNHLLAGKGRVHGSRSRKHRLFAAPDGSPWNWLDAEARQPTQTATEPLASLQNRGSQENRGPPFSLFSLPSHLSPHVRHPKNQRSAVRR